MRTRIDRVKLTAELARRDMTVKRLAELAGVSRMTVSGVKCGKACSSETASRLAEALHLPLDMLVEREA